MNNQALFSLGKIVATQGAIALLEANELNPWDYLNRHQTGDWGDLDKEDKQANQLAIQYGGQILSAYTIHNERLWIITEADRSSTTLLLPCEY